jgi:hypothetical protein
MSQLPDDDGGRDDLEQVLIDIRGVAYVLQQLVH